MKIFFLSLLLLFSFSSAKKFAHPKFPSPINIQAESLLGTTKTKLYETKYFTQILDHFNYHPQSYQTFQERYLINYKYWGGAEKNAPIFVYTGNEGDIEWFAQNTGFMFETAPHFKALLVFLEHRYYGKSIPFRGDKEIAYSNSTTLGYLSSTQALADYATLIIDLKKNLTAQDSPVIVFGGSYGGMLAAWFRLKYPHVAIGALASSAPILGFQGIVSPYSFNDIITQDFKGESENCYKVIKESWKLIEETEQKHGGLDLLKKSFKLCNLKAVGGWLQTAFVYTAMTDYPTPSNFLNPLPAYPIKQMCKAIDDPAAGNDTFAKLYGAANIYYNSSGTATCFNLSDHSDPHGLAEWTWQACTEMVLPTEGNDEKSIFPSSEWNFTDRAAFCKEYLGVEPRPNWATTEFGGMDIMRVLRRFGSNMIFFNGLRDPWSGGGYSETSGTDMPQKVNTFAEIDLGEALNQNILRCKYVKPTLVQRYAIPIVVVGRDLMACAQTGSGKTATFCFPIISGIMKKLQMQQNLSAHNGRVAYPLAMIHDEAKKFSYQTVLKSLLHMVEHLCISSVLKSISKTIIALVAKQGAHHVDLRFSDKEDPKWLHDVRKNEIHIIHKWIDQYYHDLSENLSYS